MEGFKPVIVSLNDFSLEDLWVYDESDRVKAGLLTRFFDADFQDLLEYFIVKKDQHMKTL